MIKARAYSAVRVKSPLTSTTIQRRDPNASDVQIEILFCGVCHSDLHYARDEWHSVMATVYPCVPGHEIIGRVTPSRNGCHEIQDGRNCRCRLSR